MAEGDAVAEVLVEALPYLNHYAGKTVVVKLGGSLRGGESILQDLALLKRLGIHPVLVHGGGPYITEWLERIGKTTHFVDGLRYTDEETLQVACMVLIGRVNSTLVAQLNGMGVPAMGLSGLDGGLLRAEQRDERYGLVGEVVHVDLRPLMAVTSQGYLPVVAPVALGPNGQPLNVNADTAAGELATALCAEKLIFFTDVPGVQDREGRLLSQLTAGECRALMAEGVIRGGMVPKVEACLRALGAVSRTHILDGRRPHALVRELFTDEGVGTMIVA